MTKKNSNTIEGLNSPEKIKERIENNLLLGVLSEINSIKDHPRMQVFITHGFLELLFSKSTSSSDSTFLQNCIEN